MQCRPKSWNFHSGGSPAGDDTNPKSIQFNDGGSFGGAFDIATGGNVSPGDTLFYQCWYRQSSSGGPCGNSHNLTNGLELLWGA